MYDLQAIGSEFDVFGEFLGFEPTGNGHINDTYMARYDQGGREIRYIHQRINQYIFKDPVAQMENIRRVTDHLHRRLKKEGRAGSRESLTVVPSRQGLPYFQDEAGNFWRTYVLIEDSYSVDVAHSPELAMETGRAFGRFQKLLADLPAPRLHETIPRFHHTPGRIEALRKAVREDPVGRAAAVQAEIDFVLQRADTAATLINLQEQGLLPERIVHNDTKINNVLMDRARNRALCVVDLDTVMPGLVHYDFGDMVRTVTSPAEEDEPDLSRVRMRMPYFQALAQGYLEEAAAFLTPEEIRWLAFSGKLITLEIGTRFLTDHLDGDRYFKTSRPNHNLVRARTQLRLVESIEEQEDAMQEFIDETVAQLTC